ncbi:DUF6564 domain-containing protein [Anaerocolumna sp. AGMB13020]|uniref:DUF6564 domain-containing protein n=1 Tax=Anaerocolumna sp. AGMB13020 TaxID=3081750 RepID=UPI0029531196|nr:DUF6564 domain-containing protein [Anaerocolumna sp. AGMB13020]WOO35158.1 DUF6564 domain-containing protein [Anaerocolumna sp. AGMB13020]
MKTLLLTVAGVSSRFNEGYENKILKCLYYEGDEKNTLLYRIISMSEEFDKIIIIGGYQYEILLDYINSYCGFIKEKIICIENAFYQTYGTGYSLKLGLIECLKEPLCDEIVLIEGDLYFDARSFKSLIMLKENCFTHTYEPIYADKSVVVYMQENNYIKYVYDTEHKGVVLHGNIKAIYNSAQMWKLRNMEVVKMLFNSTNSLFWEGTNLDFIEKYFNSYGINAAVVGIKNWINCNTREDYRKCFWENLNEINR